MMHLLVEDVDAWWQHIEANNLIAKYQAEPPSSNHGVYVTS